MFGSPTSGRSDLDDALAMAVIDGRGDGAAPGAVVRAAVRAGFDVFGIPHGGYLAALAARAVLLASGQPDVFTLTVHYLRKAVVGPMELDVRRLGGSRRFASWQATATQDGRAVLTALASVGDRSAVDGPSWTDVPAWDAAGDRFSPPAGDPDLPFTAPRVAERFGQRIAVSTSGFAVGRVGEHARMRAVVDTDHADQLAAIVACDVAPPAAWNALGAQGWVPTVELTVHVRARPAPRPLSIEATTHHVHDGFLEEDALVRDAEGRLVAQSRQLARWTTD
jgi:acyl-coenzyme A thioesterase PaaI-like protein